MTTAAPRSRQPKGISTGGQFAAEHRPEASGVSLGSSQIGPSVVRAVVTHRVQGYITPDQMNRLVPAVRDRLAEDPHGLNQSDDGLDDVISRASRQVLDRDVIVHRDLAAVSSGEEISSLAALRAQAYVSELEARARAAAAHPTAAPDGSMESPVDSGDPRVQDGEVFDTVTVGETVFHRRREGVYPNAPYMLRIQADRPLNDEQMRTLAGLTGYAMATTGRGEGMSDPERDSPYSFVVHNDTTKGRQYRRLDRFEENLSQYLCDGGSPVRKGDGVRAIEMPDAPQIEIYYDDVEAS